ncbi:Uncharacterised protein [Mycobacteroides abscessus]|nr:Uncharacterised protein [Mycobacteroides abscessus]
MTFIAVEQVHTARSQREHVSVFQIRQRAGARGEPHGLDVVLVVEDVDRTRIDGGFVEGESDSVIRQHDPLAVPAITADIALGTRDLLGSTDDQDTSFLSLSARGLCGSY